LEWDEYTDHLDSRPLLLGRQSHRNETRRKVMTHIAEELRRICPTLKGGAFWTKDTDASRDESARWQWRVVPGPEGAGEPAEVVLVDEAPMIMLDCFTGYR
jgi:hypothetical protein